MRLTFWGGARTVTGSAFLLESERYKVLVDCGMFQGGKAMRKMNELDFPFPPQEIDYVLLTHAHIDHSGLIPKLYKQGFKGRVLCTKPTLNLCQIMLPDSGHIQEMENEWVNRKRARSGLSPLEPLYTVEDAQNCLKLFLPIEFGRVIEVTPELSVRFSVAGHILGSAIVEVWVKVNGVRKKLVFSGDLGNKNRPIVRDPQYIEEADWIILESTYGNRFHETTEETYEELKEVIIKTVKRKGKIIIPSFAVGRTQEILYALNEMVNKKEIPLIPVYLDSPLAISATKVFERNQQFFDEEATALLLEGDNPFEFSNLFFTLTAEESKKLNESEDPCIIISASGMADAGRIKHHLKHNLWKETTSVIFVGYQAQGSLGRRILDGEKRVRILGEEVSVNAEIYSMEGLSAHADQNGLMEWLAHFKSPVEKIFLVHGEEEGIENLKRRVKEELKIEAVAPERGDSFEILEGKQEISVASRKGQYVQLPDWQLAEIFFQSLSDLESEYVAFREKLLNLTLSREDRKKLSVIIPKLEELKEKIKQYQQVCQPD
ncbi:MAG TPA: MBL fold metallo-hydrolase [Clostridia bacterium]|nr:MBL fold metallo-hydrolase [Clostridia bacterium]